MASDCVLLVVGVSQLALGQSATKKLLTPQQIFRDGVQGVGRVDCRCLDWRVLDNVADGGLLAVH